MAFWDSGFWASGFWASNFWEGMSTGDGNTLVYNISRAIGNEETITLDYVQPGDGVEDGEGNDLSSFSGQAVTNNSIV